jgi:hypothetical protein
MLQIDPWVKAAECERAIRVVADPERRSVLTSLRSLWVALGNEESIFDRSKQAGQADVFIQKRYELTPGLHIRPGNAWWFTAILLDI